MYSFVGMMCRVHPSIAQQDDLHYAMCAGKLACDCQPIVVRHSVNSILLKVNMQCLATSGDLCSSNLMQ
jgi:hypothetical protein